MPNQGFSKRVCRSLTAPFFCAMFAVAFSGCATPQKDIETSQLHLRIGTAHLIKGNYPGALKELLQAERLDPRNPVVQNNLGLVYFLREKPDLAANHLKRALELKPSYSDARNNYARALIELGRFDQAIAELQQVLGDLTYEDPAKAWVNLGLAYFRRGDFKAARDKLAEAIKLNRDHCLGQTLYGRSLLELGELPQAAQSLDNAVVICTNAKFDEPYYYSGLTYYKLGRTSSAIARMEEIVKLYPQGRYAKKAESMLKLMK